MIVINGVKYNGQNVSVIGNKVIVDGVVQVNGEEPAKVIIQGNVTSLTCDRNVEVSGNVESIMECNSLNCQAVNGNIEGKVRNINVDGDVHGNVYSDGNVICGNVQGSVKAGGALIAGR